MNNDLKIIKKRYGEKMAQLCRKLFPTLLETKGLLPQLMERSFADNNMLYNDIMFHGLELYFKGYIYSLIDVEKEIETASIKKSPEQLLEEVGYDLYVCKSEEDIQSFKKYYAKDEELCTFYYGDRLLHCHVFFAVKKNIDNIKRENFSNPRRQDEYGTSIISIQFTKDEYCTLSIKNRYNHRVNDPDATFSNNLENIIAGLTEAFEEKYNMVQKNKNILDYQIPGYVRANDGKLYKYNYEINNIYYCPNNIIIDNFKAKQLSRDHHIVLDYFILDLKNKNISLYDDRKTDAFIDSVGNIKNIEVTKAGNNKKIVIKTFESKEENIIEINKENQIIAYTNRNIREIKRKFLYDNNTIIKLCLPEVKIIGDYVLYFNNSLVQLDLPNIEMIGQNFLYKNNVITEMSLSNAQMIESGFLFSNNVITQLSLPKVTAIGSNFLYENRSLTQLSLPKAKRIDTHFLSENNKLTQLSLPSVKTIGSMFLYHNNKLTQLSMPNVENIGSCFLHHNTSLVQLDLPKVEIIINKFLYHNNVLTQLSMPNVKNIGSMFLYSNNVLTQLSMPSLKNIGEYCLFHNSQISMELPKNESKNR